MTTTQCSIPSIGDYRLQPQSLRVQSMVACGGFEADRAAVERAVRAGCPLTRFWALAGPALGNMFTTAPESVSGG